MTNPWDPELPPPGDFRVVGMLGGIPIKGEWVVESKALHDLGVLMETGGSKLRIEDRGTVDAKAEEARVRAVEGVKAALDRSGAPSMRQTELDLTERQQAPKATRPIWRQQERPRYATLKHALGDYAAHCHGPQLAQQSEHRGGQHVPAWLVVGSLLTEVGLTHKDPRRERILRWACTADDRRETHTGQRLGGREWELLKRLKVKMREAGLME